MSHASKKLSNVSSKVSKGFTLLEVMIAMAILVMALAALLGHEGIAIQMSDFSNKLGQATLLAQGKLLDVEHDLLSDSIDSYDTCQDGDFRREGFKRFEWKACAYKIEMEDGAAEQITEQFMAMMGGTAVGGATSGAQDPMMAGQLAMFAGMIPSFLQGLEDKIRKVRLEVTWKDSVDTRTLVLERYVTGLGLPEKGKTPAADGDAEDSDEIPDDGFNLDNLR